MQIPEILQGESRTRLLQGAAVGAIVTLFVGFQALGWTLGSTANKMATDQSRDAVTAALAPVCVTKFQQAEAVSLNRVEFNKESPWMRGRFIQKGGWSEFPGQTQSSSDIADACAKLLDTAKT
jgi:hypothetical protein